jgi:cysteine-rich repeat protein
LAVLLAATGGLACGRTGMGLAALEDGGAEPKSPATPDVAVAPDALAATDPPALAPDLANPNCGNGMLDPGEECDDGNVIPGDGCDASCRVECNFDHCPGPPYPPVSQCGDGIVSGAEECDLGSKNGTAYGDAAGCTSDCIRSHYCGDGIVDVAFGEECDQGEHNGAGSYCMAYCHIWMP